MKVSIALTLASSIVTSTRAFVPVGRQVSTIHTRTSPAFTPLAANPLDTLFSVLKEGKVGLVKSIAGEYDADAVRAKLDGLVEDNSVLMLSFTT